MKKIFFLFIFSVILFAKNNYSIRIAYGKETDSDLKDILTFKAPTDAKYDFSVLALDIGYLLKKDLLNIPLDFYIKGGIAKFSSEDLSQYQELNNFKDIYNNDIYEFTIYIKFYYNIKFLNNNIRIGFGEGGSYVNNYLPSEVIEEQTEDDNPKYSKYLNYLDISFDFDMGKLIKYKPLEETFIGWSIKHRSGIFGLINGVSGGSNYNTLSIERNF